MIQVQSILTVRYVENNKVETMCRSCYKQMKENTELKILPSDTLNETCSICERLKCLDRLKKKRG